MSIGFISYLIKFTSTFLATVLGVIALFGETHDKGRWQLSKLGKALAGLMFLSLLIGVAAVYFENQQDQERESELHRRDSVNLAKQAELLSDLRAVSDTLSRLRVLSETTMSRQGSALRGTASILSSVERNSKAQSRLLLQQREANFETERLRYPFRISMAEIVLEYDAADTSMLRVYADDLWTKGAEALNRAGGLLNDSSKARRLGSGRFLTKDGDLLVDTNRHMILLPKEHVFLFIDPIATGQPFRLDSVYVSSESDWLIPGNLEFKAPGNMFLSPGVELRFWEKGLSGLDTLPAALRMEILGPDTSGLVRKDSSRFSAVTLLIDFVHRKVRQRIASTFLQLAGSGITSLLDLPGGTLEVISDPICRGDSACQHAESVVELLLASDYGRGRRLRIGPAPFSVSGQGSAIALYHVRVSDIERYPNEFANLFDGLGEPRE